MAVFLRDGVSACVFKLLLYEEKLVDLFPFGGTFVFALGCVVDVLVVELFGALFIFAGLIGTLEKVWPEEVVKG